MSFNADIRTVPHDEQRYDTCGDWHTPEEFPELPPDKVRVVVSDLGNADYEFLVGVHELIEMYLCKRAGIRSIDVTRFDELYERTRGNDDASEPGDHPGAPYYKQHQIATGIERILAGILEVDWNAYEDAINSLSV